MNGMLISSEDGNLVLSISDDAGWTILVDGVEAETEKWLGAMISVPVTSGEHVVELYYRPQGVVFGTVVSVLCLAIFLLWRYMQKNKED